MGVMSRISKRLGCANKKCRKVDRNNSSFYDLVLNSYLVSYPENSAKTRGNTIPDEQPEPKISYCPQLAYGEDSSYFVSSGHHAIYEHIDNETSDISLCSTSESPGTTISTSRVVSNEVYAEEHSVGISTNESDHSASRERSSRRTIGGIHDYRGTSEHRSQRLFNNVLGVGIKDVTVVPIQSKVQRRFPPSFIRDLNEMLKEKVASARIIEDKFRMDSNGDVAPQMAGSTVANDEYGLEILEDTDKRGDLISTYEDNFPSAKQLVWGGWIDDIYEANTFIIDFYE